MSESMKIHFSGFSLPINLQCLFTQFVIICVPYLKLLTHTHTHTHTHTCARANSYRFWVLQCCLQFSDGVVKQKTIGSQLKCSPIRRYRLRWAFSICYRQLETRNKEINSFSLTAISGQQRISNGT